jgi:hypothetical protein
MECRVRGELDVHHDERLDIGASKHGSVLAALLAGTDEALSSYRLLDSVWWNQPAAASANLRAYLPPQRRVPRPPVETGSRRHTFWTDRYLLRTLRGDLGVDVDRLNQLADRGDQLRQTRQLSDTVGCPEQAAYQRRRRTPDGVPGGAGQGGRSGGATTQGGRMVGTNQ